MKTWILIVILSGTGQEIEVIEEYRTEEYCQEAAQAIERDVGSSRTLSVVCVPGEL